MNENTSKSMRFYGGLAAFVGLIGIVFVMKAVERGEAWQWVATYVGIIVFTLGTLLAMAKNILEEERRGREERDGRLAAEQERRAASHPEAAPSVATPASWPPMD